ncbi:hypothetical protein Taro_050169 [Colocasia esculenta]|uniref:Uncharacterized protein n=1 Tax=Colocasia esculenta TaxID=4460 RepID=A0A843XD65_COLES|nr:hypothetical protein [Colocasia esculenta]
MIHLSLSALPAANGAVKQTHGWLPMANAINEAPGGNVRVFAFPRLPSSSLRTRPRARQPQRANNCPEPSPLSPSHVASISRVLISPRSSPLLRFASATAPAYVNHERPARDHGYDLSLFSSTSRLHPAFSLTISMGNYISCTLSGPYGRQTRTTKVIFPGGEIRQFDGPVNAAELMLEAPNHFLVNARSMQVGRRFSPLSAEEELEAGDVYVLLPMKRVNSAATAGDMGALWMAASSAARRASGGRARILPESMQLAPPPEQSGSPVGAAAGCQASEAPRFSLEDVEGVATGEFMHRLSTCRSRKPMLETIAEEPVFSR